MLPTTLKRQDTQPIISYLPNPGGTSMGAGWASGANLIPSYYVYDLPTWVHTNGTTGNAFFTVPVNNLSTGSYRATIRLRVDSGSLPSNITASAYKSSSSQIVGPVVSFIHDGIIRYIADWVFTVDNDVPDTLRVEIPSAGTGEVYALDTLVELRLQNSDSGTFGEIQPGWRVTEESTPVAIGDASGAITSASIGIQQAVDSEFLINERVVFTDSRLGDLHGDVTSAVSNGATEETQTTIPVTISDVTASLVKQQTAQIATGPKNILSAGVLNGIVGVQRIAWDTVSDDVYVIDSISSPSPRILVVSPNGSKNYINITGVNAPTSTSDIYGMAVYNSLYLFYTVGGVRKLGVFNKTTGAIISSTGTNGTGTGQFGAVGQDVLALSSDTGIYVADYGNNRIQRFNLSGTFLSSWAAPSPWSVEVTPYRVYVNSATTSIVEYTLAGVATGRSLPAGNDFSITDGGIGLVVTRNILNVPYLELYDTVTGSLVKSIRIPDRFNANKVLSTRNFTYVATQLTPTLSDGSPINLYAIDSTTVYTMYAYFAALGGVNELTFNSANNPKAPMIPWTDSVWTKMKELAAAYSQEIAVINGQLTIRDVGGRYFDLDNVKGGSASLRISSHQTAEQFYITYLNATQSSVIVNGGVLVSSSTLYDAAVEGNTMSFSPRELTTFILKNNNIPARLDPPVFSITDTEGVAVSAQTFADSGGTVNVRISDEDPYAIEVSVFMAVNPPNTNGNYRFSDGVSPKFTITGAGIFTSPMTINMYTGAAPSTASSVRGPDVNNIFINQVAQAYNRGIHRSAQLSGPRVELAATVPTSSLDGFGLTASSFIRFKESIYRINTVQIGAAETSITATPYVTQADVQAVHAGNTMGQVDAFWANTKYKDQMIKPLRPIT